MKERIIRDDNSSSFMICDIVLNINTASISNVVCSTHRFRELDCLCTCVIMIIRVF